MDEVLQLALDHQRDSTPRDAADDRVVPAPGMITH
jgi:hypothetical protein